MGTDSLTQWTPEIEEAEDAKIIEELDAKDSKSTEQDDFEKELDEELGINKKEEVDEKKDSDEDNPDDEQEEKHASDEDKQDDDKDGDEDSDEEKPDELTDEEKAKAEEEEQKKAVEAEEERFKQYSEKHDCTLDDAKKDCESIDKISTKFSEGREDGVAKREMAQSLLYLQRQATYLSEQVKAAQAPKDGFYDDKVTLDGKDISKADMVQMYRTEYPNKTAEIEDDVIYEMAKTDFNNKVKAVNDAISKELPLQAKNRREQLVSNLSEGAKKYESEIVDILNKVPDGHIVNDSFRMSTVINSVKGNHADADIKAAREEGRLAGLAAGKEEAEILGEKSTTPSKKATSKSGKSKPSLSEEQKSEAIEMYEGDGLTEEEMFKHYADQLEREKKNKKK